jgi:N-ethylmaleimide reductase
MNTGLLFNQYKLGNIELKNRIVMAPMTRSRALGNIPNDLIAHYYEQRADAGLLITEGTSPSPNGLGYARIPGIFNIEQLEGWKKVTSAIHSRGGKIFIQLMHTGRVGHPFNLPEGSKVLAPSEVELPGQIWTDSGGMQDFPIPKAMDQYEIQTAVHEYATASLNAVKAGFDGIELHSANGYLLEQFLSPVSNQRSDSYGGTIQNRCRFVLEVAEAVVKAIGKERTGIRLSPYGVSNSMHHYPEIEQSYTYLTEELNRIGLQYIHLVDHSAMGAPKVPEMIKKLIRGIFSNTLILSGGYTMERASNDIEQGSADLIAFGKPFINNPDLVDRLRNDWPVSENPDKASFYSPGEKGYIDYPVYAIH